MPSSLRIHHYRHPHAAGWRGYLQPRDGSWLLYVDLDGCCRMFIARGPSGLALPPSAPPTEVLQ